MELCADRCFSFLCLYNSSLFKVKGSWRQIGTRLRELKGELLCELQVALKLAFSPRCVFPVFWETEWERKWKNSIPKCVLYIPLATSTVFPLRGPSSLVVSLEAACRLAFEEVNGAPSTCSSPSLYLSSVTFCRSTTNDLALSFLKKAQNVSFNVIWGTRILNW